ncbi:MAG TPA: IS1634 family transposase, partial [archaeon]|nr:IS1634 family transposase [archaeon]
MFIDVVPNRSSPPAVLLREAWREGKRIRKRTLANLSSLAPAQIDALRRILRGETLVPVEETGFEIRRTRPHGAVAAVVGMVRKLGLESLLAARPSRERSIVLALICARVLEPSSKLATARALLSETASSTLLDVLDLDPVDEDACYAALDWLLAAQPRIEAKLAKRYLSEGSLVLWDVTSTYFEGRACPLARRGHSRDGRSDRPQIVFGVLTNGDGCPIAVEVYEGNTADPLTVAAQVQKVQSRFGLTRIIVVGDRGMLTSARIREDLQPAELDWISSLRAPQIQQLVSAGDLQLSVFDEHDLAEVTSDAFPGERLIACRNPLLAEERARKRLELLEATERQLEAIAMATRRATRPLRGKDKIAVRVDRVVQRWKVGKHFRFTITDTAFAYERDETAITAEAVLDGIYVIRTSVPPERLSGPDAVGAYKNLDFVERAFRSIKGLDLQVRPIFHHLADRVRGHVFLCLLAYYLERHMRRALAPLLFMEE